MATRITELKEYILSKSELNPSTGCILWRGKLNHLGRAVFPESIRSRLGISVMVARYVLGQIPQEIDHPVAMHSCDNPSCINRNHLSWGTQKDNLEDMTRKGRRATGDLVSSPGEKNPRAKISLETVLYIRSSKKKGREIAKELGLSDTMVSRIRNNRSWRSNNA